MGVTPELGGKVFKYRREEVEWRLLASLCFLAALAVWSGTL